MSLKGYNRALVEQDAWKGDEDVPSLSFTREESDENLQWNDNNDNTDTELPNLRASEVLINY